MARVKSEETDGRRKLIDTARRLFGERGTAHVGINEVTAQAGVARMTLYNNFPSKEALTIEVYREMADEALIRIDALLAEEPSEQARIARLFRHFGRNAHKPGFRGCRFIHASLQEADPHGPIHGVVQAYKKALRRRILGALAGKRRNRDLLADQITLLLDGAVTEAYIKGVDDPLAAAEKAAMTLLRA
ncbi:TetR/AcrR family transcriptional regulator [Taklimakanibacter lacteus]|uniref:TetR/AcrR family transcriptional regulator n=1 Tax=Taklimakanibacter lacteus TaxID=2268456 RepID=UPI000E670C97